LPLQSILGLERHIPQQINIQSTSDITIRYALIRNYIATVDIIMKNIKNHLPTSMLAFD